MDYLPDEDTREHISKLAGELTWLEKICHNQTAAMALLLGQRLDNIQADISRLLLLYEIDRGD
jgi:hypothetical protein